MTAIEDVPLLSLQERKPPVIGARLKRCLDVMGALLLFVLSATLGALSVAALYAQKRKAFRKELRCGKNGVPFPMYRLNVDRAAKHLPAYARILARFTPAMVRALASRPDAGMCALYGQQCTVNADCCKGVPCTGGRCTAP